MIENIFQPTKILTVFFILTLILWVSGKFYKLPRNSATPYNGEKVNPSQVGNFVIAKGLVTSIYETRQGIKIISIKGNRGEYSISIFPSFGKISSRFYIGDIVEVAGLLNFYQNKSQINPLSSESIKLLKRESPPFPIVQIQDLGNYLERTVVLNRVEPISVDNFTSNSGKNMIRFRIQDSNLNYIEGVFYEGKWNREILEDLQRGSSIDLVAKVTIFRGYLSLLGEDVRIIN